MSKEFIVLANDFGVAVGVAPKLESHHAETPLHLAFSCYIFNQQGKFLLTKRARTKKVWPGVWTNSVCGHPMPGESTKAAIRRRAAYELGLYKINKLELILDNYRYKTPPFNGIVEHEICPVYTAVVSGSPKPNPEEVENYKWVDWGDLEKEISKDSGNYSYWLKDQLKHLRKSPKFLINKSG